MELIEGVALSQLCDYSFGDQSGQWGNIFTSFMKDANLLNLEFAEKVFEIKKTRDYMTLFIDNIRLYKRHIVEVKDSDRFYVENLMNISNLLELCSKYSDMRFIIFTNLEDTPIDDYIFDLIPENVICVSAVNAISNGGKVVPAPYGIQRKMNIGDNRSEYLKSAMLENEITECKNLLYLSFDENSHSDRKGLKKLLSWAYVDTGRVDYPIFLENLNKSKFVLCPRGNAIDCHRNWEVLYMRRVPVMKRYPYLETLFADYPVLFVDDYSEVTPNLLNNNNHLFDEVKKINLSKLTLPNYFDNIVSKALTGEYASK